MIQLGPDLYHVIRPPICRTLILKFITKILQKRYWRFNCFQRITSTYLYLKVPWIEADILNKIVNEGWVKRAIKVSIPFNNPIVDNRSNKNYERHFFYFLSRINVPNTVPWITKWGIFKTRIIHANLDR